MQGTLEVDMKQFEFQSSISPPNMWKRPQPCSRELTHAESIEIEHEHDKWTSENEQVNQIEQWASHGPQWPPAKDDTVLDAARGASVRERGHGKLLADSLYPSHKRVFTY